VTGLSFDLSEEQEQLRQTVRDFAERECPKDVARRLDVLKVGGENVAAAEVEDRIADELAGASVTEAPRMSRPAAQAESA